PTRRACRRRLLRLLPGCAGGELPHRPGPAAERRLGDGMTARGRRLRTRMRRLVVALAAVMVLVVVGTAPAAKDTLVIGMPTDVPIFDTHKATGLHNGGIPTQGSEPPARLTP